MPTRKRSLLEYSIPEPAGISQVQSQPRLGLLGTAENVSQGLGRGVTNQLAGMLGMIQNPGAVVNSLYQLSRTPPNQLAQMAVTGVKDTARNALAGPLGFGEFIGNNMSPRSLLPGVKTMREMTAYHGTPHDFDKFDSSKIGTGEGAQAYGHGLYFAESPDVARGYQTRIAGGSWVDKRGIKKQTNQIAQDVIDQARRDGLGVLEADEAAGFWSIVARDGDKASGTPGYASIKKVLDDQGIKFQQEGKLYHVDIPDEAIDKMLDWDKPLSQQPEAVRKFFEPLTAQQRAVASQSGGAEWGEFAKPFAYDPPGSELMQIIGRHVSGDRMTAGGVLGGGAGGEKASQMLKAAGIPGVRYFDGGSRGGGKGTRNFVVFDDKLVKVLKKE